MARKLFISGLGVSLVAVAALIGASAASAGSGIGASVAASAKLTTITVSPQSPTLQRGTSQQFTATGHYSDGSTKDLTQKARWSSSDRSVVSISRTGLAAAQSVGTATVSATLSKVRGSTAVTVRDLSSISVSPTAPSVPLGVSQQFTATGHYTDGSTADLTTQVTWSSSNTSVASISATGLASTVGEGSTTITARLGSLSDQTPLNVAPPELTSIQVTPDSPTVSLSSGQTIQFTATGHYTDGTSQDLTNTATWNSPDTSVATVSATGLATPVAEGQTTISATAGSISGGTVLTVIS